MPKFTAEEGRLIKNVVATLSIKRIPDSEIITEVKRQTEKRITRQTLYNVRQRIKKESYHWYKIVREGQYEYIHEFKERIDEILWLQRKHHIDINRHMKVVPVPFSIEGKNMLIHTKELLEFETPIVAINPKFEKLTTSLRTAIKR